MTDQSILWRRLDLPGHEYSRLFSHGSSWHLTGTALFAHEHEPCNLSYAIICNSNWRTVSAKVSGHVGDKSIELHILADDSGKWSINDQACPQVDGSIDIDLNFSPSTNLLPIRRLNLQKGQSALARAAWVRFPSFNVESFEQIYSRIDELTYRYESMDGTFGANLRVNETGLVIDYPGLWSIEAPV